eukprot:14402468-Ditylum_brightwellii.AAC.1
MTMVAIKLAGCYGQYIAKIMSLLYVYPVAFSIARLGFNPVNTANASIRLLVHNGQLALVQ